MRLAGLAFSFVLVACTSDPRADETDSAAGDTEASVDTWPTPEIQDEPCDNTPQSWPDKALPTETCGSIELPVDYAKPHGDTFALHFHRFEATNPGANVPTVFVNPGGPGGSGVDTMGHVYDAWPAEMLEGANIVGFDPRGVGRSGGAVFDVAVPQLDNIDPLPANAEAFRSSALSIEDAVRRRFDAQSKYRKNFLLNQGTAQVVRDMEVLRRALGVEDVAFHGVSYGAFLGTSYAVTFPNRVDRFVLDAPPEPTADLRAWFVNLARGEQRTLVEAIDACADQCGLAPPGEDALVALELLVHELHQDPRQLVRQSGGASPRGEELYGLHVVRALTYLPYQNQDQRQVMLRNLAALHDPDDATRELAELAVVDAAERASLGTPDLNIASIFCADQSPRLDLEEVIDAVEVLQSEGNLFRVIPLMYLSGCSVYATAEADPPTLVLDEEANLDGRMLFSVATRDGVTPSGALDGLNDLFEGGHEVVTDSDRHGITFSRRNACADQVAVEHLLRLGPLPTSTNCALELLGGQTCGLFEDPPCGPGYKCGVPSKGATPRCVDAGSRQRGESCPTLEACDEGLQCSGFGGTSGAMYTCQPVCLDQSQCAADEICVEPDAASSAQCVTMCDPWTANCADGGVCNALFVATDGTSGMACASPGTVGEGSSCLFEDSCNAGLVCHAGRCRPPCDATHACATGTCQLAGDGPFGFCVP